MKVKSHFFTILVYHARVSRLTYCVSLLGGDKLKLMKKNFLLFLIIIFSSLFLALPNKAHAEIKCGDSCYWADDCKGASGGCTLCEDGVCVSREEAYGEQETTKQQTEEARDKLGVSELAPQINKIVNYSTGIGGIIAFLLIVFGGFQIILSGGSPERVKAGKEMITSAIAGLLLIIFAVFILRLIGYDILNIPGFGE